MSRFFLFKKSLERSGHSRATRYRLIESELWTKPVKISERRSGWPDDEDEAQYNARVAGLTEDQIRELVVQLYAKRAQLAAELIERISPDTRRPAAPTLTGQFTPALVGA